MEDQGLDFISSLPEDILRRIVSLIPLKEAVRTSAFSSAWRGLWLPVSLTCRRHEELAQGELEEIICLLSKCCDSHQIWKLFLATKGDHHQLIVLATKGVEQELHLQFPERDKEAMNFFDLKLKPSGPDSQTIRFSTLKMLHLRSVNSLGKDLISGLFSRSKFLVSLELESCSGLQSLDIEANDHLQSLKLLNCPDMTNINISAGNLRSFSYQGVLPQVQLKNALELVEVTLDLRNGFCSSEFDCEDVIFLLTSIKDIEILTISSWLLEWLCSGGVIFSRLEFRFNKLKELSWMGSEINKNQRDSLACFLNICPSLEKLLIKIDPDLNSVPCPYFHQYWHEPHLWLDDATVNSNTSELQHLKTVDFLGYKSEKDQFLLLLLLLDKSNKLKSITVTSPENHSWEVAKITQRQQLKQTWNPINQQQQNTVFSLMKGFFLERLMLFYGPEKAGIRNLGFWF
ncbi:hypothetical protein PTKIN_Ptkin06aG0029300 [Pterospermum kingtungense]